jgi:hypothetical protein
MPALDTNGFVTSRPFALPTDAAEMAGRSWFHLWERRLWPYTELQEGDTLYWYDTTRKAIVWQSRVAKVERFGFANKEEVRRRLQDFFHLPDLKDPYFDQASDRGYCLAYKIDSVVQRSFPKPGDYQFPQAGWARCADENVQKWVKDLPSAALPDGPNAEELSKIASHIAETGYFSTASLIDERKKTLREIVERRGQPEFRDRLIAAYGGVCAVTGCDAMAALEACHLAPYSGPKSNHVTNGLLLRADIHTLFDLELIGIDPKLLTLNLAPAIQGTAYGELQGRKLRAPSAASDAPNKEALVQRWGKFKVG